MIKGKHIAITGILAFYKRKDAFDMIRDYGGIPQENVTKETDKRNGLSGGRLLSEEYS